MEIVKKQNSRRLFIGIPVIENECPKFFSWSKNLINETNPEENDVRWEKPENFHITVCFLGDSPTHNIEKIIKNLNQIHFPSFWIQIQQIDFFTKGKHSNVIWAGIDSKDIGSFHQIIEQSMMKLGYPKNIKTFRPHITIGRSKKFDHAIKESSISVILDQFKVNQFCLFESVESEMRVEYKILERFLCR